MIKLGSTILPIIANGVRSIQTQLYDLFTVDARQVLPPGIDSSPIPDEPNFSIKVDGKKTYVNIGVNPVAEALPGEIIIYSRLPDGTKQASIYCDASGLIEIKNQVTDLKTEVDGLIDEIKGLITNGGPTSQSVSVASQALLDLRKTTISLLLK